MMLANALALGAVRQGGGGWLATKDALAAYLETTDGIDNPHSLDAMSSPPVITTGTSLSTLGAPNLTQVIDALNMPSSIRFTGGGSEFVATVQRRFPASSRISGGTVSATEDPGCWKAGIQTNAAKVAVRVSGSTTELYRFLVDGQYVSFAGTAVGTSGANTYALLDFGSSQSRLIEVENGASADGRSGARAFVSFSIDPADAFSAPPIAPFPTMFLGDSFTAPTGVTQAGDGFFAVAADYLGLKDRWNSGQGGTGYVADAGTGTKYKLGDRLAADLDRMIAISPPKVIFVAMGLNDLGLSGIQSAASACFDVIRQKCPSALVFVTTGVWDVQAPSAPASGYSAAKSAIVAAMTGRGGFYALDMEGVSYTKIGDATHPDDLGHSTLGLSMKLNGQQLANPRQHSEAPIWDAGHLDVVRMVWAHGSLQCKKPLGRIEGLGTDSLNHRQARLLRGMKRLEAVLASFSATDIRRSLGTALKL